MNQEKIGKFIQEKRKEKNMTQLELAGNLGVSEKTISNWETGRNMPDLSLFKPLCKELDISINDLMNGEKINKEEYQDKLEETIIKTIDYKDKKNNMKIKLILLLVVVLILISSLFTIFISVMRPSDVDSYPSYQIVQIEKDKYDKLIKDSILSNLDWHFHEDGKWFVEYKVYSIEDTGNDFYYIYTWVIESEYAYQNGVLRNDSGSSYPCRFELKNNNGIFELFGKSIPRDGNYYIKDMEEYFPEYVRNQMNNNLNDGTLEELSNKLEQQAKEYYKIN